MSKADEMFKALGYAKKETYWDEDKRLHYIVYNTSETLIEFSLDTRSIEITNIINIKELQAINQKVKEMRLE